MIVARKGAGLAFVKFLIFSILFMVITGLATGLAVAFCFILSFIGDFEILYTIIVSLVWFISVIIAIVLINHLRGYRKTVVYIDDIANVDAVYKGKPYSFNMGVEYGRYNLSLTHYTYSHTAMIVVENAFGYKIVIKGQRDLLNHMLSIASIYGMKVFEVND